MPGGSQTRSRSLINAAPRASLSPSVLRDRSPLRPSPPPAAMEQMRRPEGEGQTGQWFGGIIPNQSLVPIPVLMAGPGLVLPPESPEGRVLQWAGLTSPWSPPHRPSGDPAPLLPQPSPRPVRQAPLGPCGWM